MSAVIQQELTLLVMACALGMVMGLCYDLVRMARVLVHHSSFMVSIEDVAVWLVVFVTTFAFCLAYQAGEVRGITLGAQLLGFVLYRLTVSRVVLYLCTPILRVVHRFLAVLIHPIGWILQKVWGHMTNFVKKTLKKRKKFLKTWHLHLKSKG